MGWTGSSPEALIGAFRRQSAEQNKKTRGFPHSGVKLSLLLDTGVCCGKLGLAVFDLHQFQTLQAVFACWGLKFQIELRRLQQWRLCPIVLFQTHTIPTNLAKHLLSEEENNLFLFVVSVRNSNNSVVLVHCCFSMYCLNELRPLYLPLRSKCFSILVF